MAIVEAFVKFPEEAAIIGRLLAGYTWLEIAMMQCVQVVRGDMDTVLKVMYRTRGESQRIDVCDAFGRQHYESVGLGTPFAMAIGAMEFCVRVRNQYSHSIWSETKGKLTFVNFEEIAKSHTAITYLADPEQLVVDLPLLQAQEEYFLYTSQLFGWVQTEGQFRKMVSVIPGGSAPKQLEQPLLYMP